MIEINNLTTSSVDEEFFKTVAKKVLKGENKEEAGLSIVLVGAGRIRALNRKYRKKNRVTDVLAFGEIPNSKWTFRGVYDSQTPDSIERLGEIVICLREVKKNAERYKSTFEKELAYVLIHGILHLLEYDHEKTKKEAEKMSEKEEHYLSQI